MANIYDLTWSPCGEYICTGSIMDNVANIWHVASRTYWCTAYYMRYDYSSIFLMV